MAFEMSEKQQAILFAALLIAAIAGLYATTLLLQPVPVQASITYADGKVLFATNSAHGTVYALNATSGTLIWSFEPSPAEYILGSPVVADGVVFAPSDNGHVYALGQSLAAPNSMPASLSPWVYLGAPIVVAAVIAVLVVFAFRRRPRRGP